MFFVSAWTGQEEQLFCSVPPRRLFWKTVSVVSISMSSDHRDGRTTDFSSTSIIIGSNETWGEQTRFYFWKYLAVACHKLSHFNSQVFILDFIWNCCRLQEVKKFSRNPGQNKCVARATRYHISIAELLMRNL